MKLTLQVFGLGSAMQTMQGLSDRRLRAAAATALTRTAVQVREAERQLAQRVFDRPTPYTLRQLRYTPASADRLVAEVGFDIAAVTDIRGTVQAYRALGPGETPASKYLQFQVDGGQRRTKRFEAALQKVGVLPAGWVTVPGQRARIDAFGNQSPGELRQILSWFDAAELVDGSRQNMRQAGRDKRIKGTRRRAGWEYVAIEPGGTRAFVRAGGGAGSHKMQPGIYRRTHLAMGTRLEPIVIFVRAARYTPRFDFYGEARRVAAAVLPVELGRALSEAVARSGGRR